MSKWIPETELDTDGVERHCSECGNKIETPRVTAGHVGSGRVVLGGYYGVPGREGVFCPSCATMIVGGKE